MRWGIRSEGIWPEHAEQRAISTLANPGGFLLDAMGAAASYSGERVTVKGSLGLGAVFAATERISEVVGSLPLKVFRIMEDDERVEARTHRSWRLLHDKPNEYTTAHRFWSTTTAHLLLYGNAFLYKERGAEAEVESLWLLDPAEMEVRWDGRNKSFVHTVGSERRNYSVDEVLHIPAFSLDGIYGCSRISYCKQTLGTAIARAKFEGGFYKRGAKVPGVIQHPGRLNEGGVKNLGDSFARWHSGVESMHKVPVLEEGAEFKPLAMALEDMQFVEQKQLSATEIAVLFGLPPGELGGMHGGSLEYSTEELNQIRFSRAIWPLTNTIQEALTSDPAILPWNVMYAEFVLEAMMRPDMKTQAEFWEKLKDVLDLDPEYIAGRLNIPKDAIKEPEPPPPVATESAVEENGTGNGVVPPEMAQMQNALKQAAS
jgi:HK97 family phage portal protein